LVFEALGDLFKGSLFRSVYELGLGERGVQRIEKIEMKCAVGAQGNYDRNCNVEKSEKGLS
jgi:hypothetical protein